MSKTAPTHRRSPDANTLTRRASFDAKSFDSNARTFTAVISSGSAVKRRDPFDGSLYNEALAVTPSSVRLDRARSGVVPLLNSHRASTLDDQIGVVTDVRIEGGQLVADIRLSPSDAGKAVAAAIEAGTPPNISIGYVVHNMTEGVASRDAIPTHTATDWELLEVSLVPIPADPQTFIRSHKGNNMPIDESIEIDDDNEQETEYSKRNQPRAMSDRDARAAYDIAARAHLPAEFARQHIEQGVTLAQFRTLVFNKLADAADRTQTSSIRSDETFDNPNFLNRTIEDVLYARMAGKPVEGAAREMAGRTLLDLGTMVLQSRGERVSWSSRAQIADHVMQRSGGYHTTSDFPILLQGAGQRVLRDAYQAAETPLKLLARRRTAVDFRPMTSAQLSEAPQLLEVGEAGQIKYGSRSESKEVGSVKTYARLFSISRNALINDDLDAFGNSARDWGKSAAETEAGLLVALLTANNGDGPTLSDGNPVYKTTRGNKASVGSAITVDALGDGRQALRNMKGLDGKTPINAIPKHLVVGSAKETEAEQVLAAIAAAHVDDVNPFSGKMALHVEPRLAGNAWRLFADPSQVSSIVIAYLNDLAGPQLAVQEGWTTLGAEFRAVLDFGCWMEDWRGTYLNPGN